MSKAKGKAKYSGSHHTCSVIDCRHQSMHTHKVPAQDVIKKKWIDFIFDGRVPVVIKPNLHVCHNHFTLDSWENLAQVQAGLATKRFLKRGAIPTIRHLSATPSTEPQPTTSGMLLRRVEDFGCQTKIDQRTCGTQLRLRKPQFRSIGIQTDLDWSIPRPRTEERGVNTDQHPASFAPGLVSTPSKPPCKRPRLDPVDEEDEDEEDTIEGPSASMVVEESGSEYNPDESLQLLEHSQDVLPPQPIPAHKEDKYIVFESKIMELFKTCSVCQGALVVKLQHKGTLLKVFYDCKFCESKKTWESQPIIGSTPAGNVQLSAAVYLSGGSFLKVHKIFKAMHLQIYSYNTFLRHAKGMIEPAIVHTWKKSQDDWLQKPRPAAGVILGGDMRADSPGHCAKYGSYTMMDLKEDRIIDLQLVQSNEVGGSYHMELEGLSRSLKFLKDRGVPVNCIVTDRHPQIQKYLREVAKIPQFYDVWHVEKGLSKKIEALSKNTDCIKVRSWIPSIRNHMYWTAATSTTPALRAAKWRAIVNHVCNIHKHRNEPEFPKCLHPQRRTRDKKKWLTPGSTAVYKLDKLLYNTRVMKDIAKLSPHHQTSSIESYHSVVIRFAPKSVAFKFIGMLCRLYLAAMHYNENAGRPQKKGKDGKPLFKVNFSKARKGACRGKPIMEDPTFDYVADLQDCIFEKVMMQPAPNSFEEAMREIQVPEDLAAQYHRPDREEVINAFVSRFNRGHAP